MPDPALQVIPAPQTRTSFEGDAVRILDELVLRAVNAGASDIHLEPKRERMQVRFRVDGSMAEQNSITQQNLKQWMAEFAVRNRLNPKAIVQSLKDPRFCATVDQDLMTGTARGITKTPTVIVGGKTFVETVLYDDVASVLNEALK